MIIKAQTGLAGDGFLANPSLCGQSVWDYYAQAWGAMLHVGTDYPCDIDAVYRIYIRISLAAITGPVTSAYLKFYNIYAGDHGSSPNAGVTLYEIADFGSLDSGDWSYSDRATFGTVLSPGQGTGWISVDVTARVQAAKAEGLGYIAFMLAAQDEGPPGGVSRWYAISAADNGSDLEPRLDVAFQAAGAPPSGLAASVNPGPTVGLSWSDNTSGGAQEDGFYIEKNADGTGWAQIEIIQPDVTTYVDEAVAWGHVYAYRVRAHNAQGYTEYSNEAEASTESSMPINTVGAPKPVALGVLYNVSPILIDQDNYVYQVNDPAHGPIEAFDAVYVSGLRVTTGFSLNLTLGTITFTSAPGGPVTCDVRGVQDNGVHVHKCGDLISWLLRNLGGVAADNLIAADFAQFNLDVPYSMGLYISAKTGIQDALDALLSGTRSYCGPVGDEKWALRQCLAASGAPDLELTDQDILALDVRPLEDQVIWRCNIQGNRNWTPNSSPAEAVSEERRAWLKDAYRQGSAEDSNIKTLYPLAGEAGPHQTCLAQAADCALLAQTWIDVCGTQRLLVALRTKLQAQGILPGDVIKITYAKWGFAAGRLGRVLRVSKTQAPTVGIELEALV